MSAVLRKVRHHWHKRHDALKTKLKAGGSEQRQQQQQQQQPDRAQTSTGTANGPNPSPHGGYNSNPSIDRLATDLDHVKLDEHDGEQRDRGTFDGGEATVRRKPLGDKSQNRLGEKDEDAPVADSAVPTPNGGLRRDQAGKEELTQQRPARDDAGHPGSDVEIGHFEDPVHTTTVHEHYDPAVTHETIHQQTTHIRQEHITREIHHHDVVHRILPIKDVEVLPARHFVPVGNGFAEVPEEEVNQYLRAPAGITATSTDAVKLEDRII